MSLTRDRLIALGLGAIAIATIIAGFALGGNPSAARREQRDQKRVEALSMSQSSAENYYRITGSVPTSQEVLSQARVNMLGAGGNVRLMQKELWPDYAFVSGTRYTLCTTFEEASQDQGYNSMTRPAGIGTEETPNFWSHAAGKTCYTISIPSFVQEEITRLKAQSSSTRP